MIYFLYIKIIVIRNRNFIKHKIRRRFKSVIHFFADMSFWEREAGYPDILPAQALMVSFGAFLKKRRLPSCLNSAAGMVFCEACFFFFPQLMLRPHCAKNSFLIGSKRNTRILECLFQIRDDIVYIFNTDGKTDQIGRYAGLFFNCSSFI